MGCNYRLEWATQKIQASPAQSRDVRIQDVARRHQQFKPFHNPWISFRAEKLATLFPKTFGKPLAKLVPAAAGEGPARNPIKIGCVLSGGQVRRVQSNSN